MGKQYKIILIDPAWFYNDKGHAGKRGAEYKYKAMTDTDILSLPIKDIAAPQAALFLWITMPRLPFGFEVMKAWGFKHKTTAFTFVKKNKIADTFFIGTGSYTRANPELCLLGFNGKPLTRKAKNVQQLVVSHIQQHSQKPAEVRDRIVQLFGDLPRIEIFARPPIIDGWDMIGNAIDGKDIKVALDEMINS